MKVLVINAGSSSLKYQVIDMEKETMLGKGLVEKIGQKGANLEQKANGKVLKVEADIPDHTAAFRLVMKALTGPEKGIIKDMSEIGAIGHRYVHSGDTFKENVVVTADVMEKCRQNVPLAPLHMPGHISCTESCMALMPDTPNVIVFDTVFHATMPDYAYMYAIKYEDYEEYHVRRYGFHGTSHKFVSEEAIKALGNPKHSKIITCHLGNGSSMSAVVDGKCVDTSMGLTPLEGMVMGSRCGDMDPAAVTFLAEQKELNYEQMSNYMNKECGFKGIAGESDFRKVTELCQGGDEKAQLAVNMFAYRVKKYIGAYTAVMDGLDAVVFTGGIGENASFARENIMKGLDSMGIDFDFDKNATAKGGEFHVLSKDKSKVKVFVIPTNEELVIAREAKKLVENAK